MIDREPTIPNQYKITFSDGTVQNVKIERNDFPVEGKEGTPLNRATLFSPAAQALFELDDNATPNDAFLKIIPKILDTGWLDLWPNKDPSSISEITAVAFAENKDYAPMYRKIGSIVDIRGIVSPKTSLAASIDATIIVGYLPEGFRPLIRVNKVIQGSYLYRALLTIGPDGEVAITRYGEGNTPVAMVENTWLPFDQFFLIE